MPQSQLPLPPQSSCLMDEFIQLLLDLTREGDDNNTLIFHLSDVYYLQVLGQRDNPEVLCEAVGNAYLEDDHQLTPEQQQRLLDLGWGDDFNYQLDATIDTPQAAAALLDLLQRTATEVYQCPLTEDTEVSLSFDEEEDEEA